MTKPNKYAKKTPTKPAVDHGTFIEMPDRKIFMKSYVIGWRILTPTDNPTVDAKKVLGVFVYNGYAEYADEDGSIAAFLKVAMLSLTKPGIVA